MQDISSEETNLIGRIDRRRGKPGHPVSSQPSIAVLDATIDIGTWIPPTPKSHRDDDGHSSCSCTARRGGGVTAGCRGQPTNRNWLHPHQQLNRLKHNQRHRHHRHQRHIEPPTSI